MKDVEIKNDIKRILILMTIYQFYTGQKVGAHINFSTKKEKEVFFKDIESSSCHRKQLLIRTMTC